MEALIGRLQKAFNENQLLKSTIENILEFIRTNHLPTFALDSVEELVNKEAWEELNNRFFKRIDFGTAGMRGRIIGGISTNAEYDAEEKIYLRSAIGCNCLNDFNIIAATIGLFNYCKSYLETSCEFQCRPGVVVAYDSRYFSKHFCELVASTWSILGGDAYIFDGPRSTPQLSFSVRYLKTTTGVMITASHNPFFDNGFKVYFEDGAQINEVHAHGIMRQIQQVNYSEVLDFLEKDFRRIFHLSPLLDEAYLDCVQESILDRLLFRKLRGTKVVYTPMHGTGSVCIVPLMKIFEWDLRPVEEQMKMDGGFPTVKLPNPDNKESLALAIERANACGAEVIIATDPDGDRMSACLRDNDNWCLLNGNTIAIMLAEYRLQTWKRLELITEKDLSKLAVIKSFVTTPLLKSFATKNGLKLIETHTGFKWIGEKLNDYEKEVSERLLRLRGLKIDYIRCRYQARKDLMLRYSTFLLLAAEESCGFLANDAVRDKDANAAMLMFCEMIAYFRTKEISFKDYLDEIYCKYGYFNEDLLSFTFEGAEGVDKIQRLMASYRSNSPKRIAESRVLSVQDFKAKSQFVDADGKAISPADFIIIRMLNGCSVAIRPSGTEPKLKLYLYVQAEIEEGDALAQVKKDADKKLEALKLWLQEDIAERMR